MQKLNKDFSNSWWLKSLESDIINLDCLALSRYGRQSKDWSYYGGKIAVSLKALNLKKYTLHCLGVTVELTADKQNVIYKG